MMGVGGKTGVNSFLERCLSVHLMLLEPPQAALVVGPGESRSSPDFMMLKATHAF